MIENDNIAYFDVDETLVLWTWPEEEFENTVLIANNWFQQLVLPHKAHIEQLKHHKARGHAVVVWSQGGYEWAEAVIKILGLSEYVDLVISKPKWAWDDLPANAFINTIYKKSVEGA